MKKIEFIAKSTFLLLLSSTFAFADGCNVSKYVMPQAFKDPFTAKLSHALFVKPDLFSTCTSSEINSYLQSHTDVSAVLTTKKLTLSAVTELVGILNQNRSIDSAWVVGQNIGDELASQLATTKYIKYFDFDYDNLTANAAKSLATNTTVQWLSVDDNSLGDDGAAILTTMPNVTYLSMSGDDLTNLSATSFANDRALRRLNVSYNYQLTDAAAPVFASSKSIRSLSIGMNQMTDAGVVALVNDNKLRHLDIDSIFMLGKTSVNTINALAANTTLKSVVLSNDSLTDAELQQLSANKTLTHIDVTSNPVTDAGVLALLTNSSLRSLGLDSTEVSATASYQAIAAANLKQLKIENTQEEPNGHLSTDNVNAIATGHYSLLELSGCGITDDEMSAIAAMSNLRTLWVDTNDIHDAGAYALVNAAHLRKLDISFNYLTAKGISALEADKTIWFLNTQDQGTHSPLVKKLLHKFM